MVQQSLHLVEHTDVQELNIDESNSYQGKQWHLQQL